MVYTKNQILKFDGSKLTYFNNVYDAELKNKIMIQDHIIGMHKLTK